LNCLPPVFITAYI